MKIGSEWLVLYPRFDAAISDLPRLGKFPRGLIRDMEFFIRNPDVSPLLKTNTDIAFQLGQLPRSTATKALCELFFARDKMIKGFVIESALEHLVSCECLIKHLKSSYPANVLLAQDNMAFELTRRKTQP